MNRISTSSTPAQLMANEFSDQQTKKNSAEACVLCADLQRSLALQFGFTLKHH